ncbi:hypothetical protein WN48_08010 [Eufriesea mexicana]|nr:hypothetical protein WN48_08010 [Eufriesea mexicana]
MRSLFKCLFESTSTVSKVVQLLRYCHDHCTSSLLSIVNISRDSGSAFLVLELLWNIHHQ